MLLKASSRVDRVASLIIFSMVILWLTVGYFVAPVLFSELPAKLAGEVAGQLFSFSSLTLLVTLIMVLGVYIGIEQSIRSVKSLVMGLFFVCLLRFWIAPWMVEIKEAYPQGLQRSSADWENFSTLHGVYQLFFLVVIILLLFWSFKKQR
ncbi:hypothetical protein MNBD_GAMMA04-1732 [hydrothermal vent metagenome]|uniref:TMEM205-like domain-containing protein n=1 Tax=hydrothermal vent metagenome TaxID=652676 RepID=A0A3B0WGH7_9ZZZZ